MLDSRKKDLLNLLLETESYFSVDSLAKSLGVSEKTIRNDLKALDDWLKKFSDIRIIRKPSHGVYLQANSAAKQSLRNEIKHKNETSLLLDQESRKLQIIRLLLETDKIITMQQLADKFYVSKTTISYDLAEVETWLSQFGLKLVRKPNYGLRIEGEERSWRRALFKTIERLKMSFNQESNVLSEQMYVQGDSCEYELVLIESKIRSLEPLMDFRFTDQAIMSLILHIAIAVKRIKLKKKIQMPQAELVKLQKKAEYDLAVQLVRSLEKAFAVSFPEAEIGYITLHLLGAKVRYDDEASHEHLEMSLQKIDPEALSVAKKIILQVEKYVHESLFGDQELLIGLAIHLHSALNRLRHGLSLSNPMIQEIKQMYRYTFEAVLSVTYEIEKEIGVPIPEDEIGYITLHIQAALVRKDKRQIKPKKALIVCSTGTGTSQLLVSKLKRNFPSLEIVKTISAFDLKQALYKYHPDVVISTIPLPDTGIPTISVSPLLTESDQSKIEAFMEQRKVSFPARNTSYSTIKKFLSRELIYLDVHETERFQVIDFLADQFILKGFVKKEYKESVMQREWKSGTAIGGGIAIPHGHSDFILHSAIAVARLKEPIDWGGESVSFVFMLAIKLSERDEVQRLFEEISALVDDPNRRSLLKEQETVEGFFNQL
jgi:activator of the mannose operon (transcriptional antiterminator)